MARQTGQSVPSGPDQETITLFKKQTLGRGSYGVVCKAKYGDLPCAAKLIQAIFFEDRDPDAQLMVEKFWDECRRMSAFRHPNIIQYLASYVDPETRLPVLLMEEMDESLTALLERSAPSLPLQTQVSICNDVAMALSYLHSRDIIHRDLSSNNVLLISDRRAKVTDFGMSRLARLPAQTRELTRCPGCLVYMPPEALDNSPAYSFKLDVFSFGVLVIQILTCKFPNPGPQMREVVVAESPQFPWGGQIRVAIPEVERRKADIDAIDSTHPLKGLALPCLKDEEKSRPSIKELCRQLSELKQITPREGSQPTQKVPYQQLEELNRQLTKQLQVVENDLKAKDAKIRTLETELATVKKGGSSPSDSMQCRHDMQVDLLLKEKHDLEQQLKEATREHTSAGWNSLWSGTTTPPPSKKRSNLPLEQTKSIPKRKAPEQGLCKGVMAAEEKKCYFSTTGNTIFSYNTQADRWEQLPDYPYTNPGIAIVKGRVTGVGGIKKTFGTVPQTTNLLYSLVDGIWVEMVPSMPTKQYSPTSFCSKSLLIVAGGRTLGASKSMVDVLNTITYRWSSVSSPLSQPQNPLDVSMGLVEATGKFYVTGGSEVFECSLSVLQSTPPDLRFNVIQDPPIKSGSIAVLRDQLVYVGGLIQGKPVSSIHAYSPEKNSWYPIGELLSARSHPTTVPISPDSLLVVPGSYTTTQDTEVVIA